MPIPTLPGITSEMVQTEGINAHVLFSGPADGVPVIFIHGNCSSATFWEETMLALPEGFRGVALDLRGYGDTEPLPIDATRGMEDMMEDVRAVVESLNLDRHHLVGHSMGGGVVMKYAIAYPADLLSIALVDSVSPYGYSGSKDIEGTPVHEDGAPAGAGGVNPEFVQLMRQKERGAENPTAPINVMRQFYFKPPFVPEREEALLSSMLSTRVGDEWYPGNSLPSENWPGAAPGAQGVVNAFSRKYFDASGLAGIDPQPPILWVRGADDLVVSDMGLWDIAALGKLGYVPGWPGDEVCCPQPMLSQTRAVLDQYEANGGRYREVIIEEAGHTPYIEKPDEFNAILHEFLLASEQ